MKTKLCRTAVFVSIAALAVLFCLGVASFDSKDTSGLSVTRALASVAFTALIVSYGYKIWNVRLNVRGVLFSLPALVIAVNNFPWVSLLSKDVSVSVEPRGFAMLALECLLIGIFEETAFRGIITLTILERFGKTKKQVFLVVVLTSAVFGVAHVFNLFAGAGLLPTLQQIGYSFLIGGMCSLILLKTRSLPLCIVIHALYDFCGFVTPRFGSGTIWTAAEIIWTAIVAVAVFVFYLRAAFLLDTYDADGIF